jgi:hypothetical protein
MLFGRRGAERLAGDRRLAAYKAKAKDFVTAFDYRDQFSGKPKRDEQGTRDRPFDLTVDFDKEKIDGVLKALGLKPWLSQGLTNAAPVLGTAIQAIRKLPITAVSLIRRPGLVIYIWIVISLLLLLNLHLKLRAHMELITVLARELAIANARSHRSTS